MGILQQELFMFLGMKEFEVILFVKVKADIQQSVSKEVVLPFCFCSWSLSFVDNKGQAK